MKAGNDESHQKQGPHREGAGQALVLEATELFRDSSVLFIDFRGERYQLRQTRNGKLILTK
jgi:hemin uptake protein HemP